jgi:hypothetical protein
VNGLHEELDRALRALPVSAAPVERTRRAGRRLRTRRRLGAAAGALAVVAAAVVVPTLVTAPAPADPVLSAGPPAAVTRAPGGLASKSDLIATGTVGDRRWQVTVSASKTGSGTAASQFCYTVSPVPAGGLPVGCGDIVDQPANALSPASPVSFTSAGADSLGVVVGTVAPEVSSVVVTFTDGQQLTLTPVTVRGHRYVAWSAPLTSTVARVAAHLGGPYSDSGQFAGSIPYDQPGQTPVFAQWQRNGYPAAAVGIQVVGHGGRGSQAWSVSAYVGPWGTCFDLTGVAISCLAKPPATTGLLGGAGNGSPGAPEPRFGSAAPGVTTVRFTLSNGQVATVHPVSVGGEPLYAFWPGPGVTPVSFTAYDAAGHQVGAGPVKS